MSKKFFQIYSWFLVGYNILVIMWGAVVRATGSGAGCGNHWPLCNGEIIPQLEKIETKIELFHRVTTSLDGLLVIILVIFALRLYTRKSNIFRWALIALAFILIEGFLGRMLVIQDWVADNVSVMRAIAVAVHLINTYFLLASLTITAWLGNKKEIKFRKLRIANTLIIIGLTLAIIFSAMGAVTALGDTLFPSKAISFDLQKNFDPTNNFLIRLRVIHPILAIISGSYILMAISFIKNKQLGKMVDRRGNWLTGVIIVQVLAGGTTILTLAPLFMQMLHLMFADIFWVSLVLFSVETITVSDRISNEK